MSETAEVSVAQLTDIAPRPGVTVVTNENFDSYVDNQLGVKPADDAPAEGEEGAETTPVNQSPEEIAAAELKAIEELKNQPKEGDVDGPRVYFKGKWVSKQDFNYRLHVKTEEAERKVADKITEAENKAKTEAERAAKAERDAQELRAKYEPVKEELGAEPTPDQFKDATEYGKALKDWTAESIRREDAAKAQTAERVKSWKEKQDALVKEVPDYQARIDAAATVPLSEELRDAILDSDDGPRLLLYFADNQGEIDRLCGMRVDHMLRELGRIDGKLTKAEVKAAAKQETKATIAEISAAPAPITPLRGANAPVANLSGSDEVPKDMTYEDWKKRRMAGKIK
jgi:hypothetical protein